MNREIPEILDDLMERRDYGFKESYALMSHLMEERFSDSQVGAILCAFRFKGETPQEIAGFASAMRDKAIPFPLTNDTVAIDNCGTGGDGKGTFNISTASALLANAMGLKVVKHGNRSVSSRCGSADFLETLSIRIDLPVEKMQRFFDETGFAFLYAPLYHPAMKAVQKVRKELGIRTVFNLLGPLTNPAPISHKLVGVYKAELVEPVAHALAQLGIQRGMVLWGEPGIDEVSVCGITRIALIENNTIQTMEFHPEQIGLKTCPIEELSGGNPHANAQLFYHLLQGDLRGTLRTAVVLNTAFLIWLVQPEFSLHDAFTQTETIIDSGKAREKIRQMIILSNKILC